MLAFNTLLQGAGFNDLKKVFLLRHEDKRVKGGIYKAWKQRQKDFEAYQNIQKWKNRFPEGSSLAAFVVGPARETLFVGMYDVLKLSRISDAFVDPLVGKIAPDDRAWHETSQSTKMREYVERLVIDWGAGRNWRQLAWKNDKSVLAIREHVKDPPFPGYINLLMRLEELENPYPSWQTLLEAQKGVYLLTFDDGMQYVGSATGLKGFWQRWSDYLATGNGGNHVLKKDGRDASKAMVSILEVSGSAQSEPDIIAQEMLWQRKLGTRAKPLETEVAALPHSN